MELTSVWVSTSFKQKLKTLFILVSMRKITKKHLKPTKRVKAAQKVYPPAFGWVQKPQAGQNPQHVIGVLY